SLQFDAEVSARPMREATGPPTRAPALRASAVGRLVLIRNSHVVLVLVQGPNRLAQRIAAEGIAELLRAHDLDDRCPALVHLRIHGLLQGRADSSRSSTTMPSAPIDSAMAAKLSPLSS